MTLHASLAHRDSGDRQGPADSWREAPQPGLGRVSSGIHAGPPSRPSNVRHLWSHILSCCCGCTTTAETDLWQAWLPAECEKKHAWCAKVKGGHRRAPAGVAPPGPSFETAQHPNPGEQPRQRQHQVHCKNFNKSHKMFLFLLLWDFFCVYCFVLETRFHYAAQAGPELMLSL